MCKLKPSGENCKVTPRSRSLSLPLFLSVIFLFHHHHHRCSRIFYTYENDDDSLYWTLHNIIVVYNPVGGRNIALTLGTLPVAMTVQMLHKLHYYT